MKVHIEWEYKTQKGAGTTFRSEIMPAAQAQLIAEDIERTGRAKNLLFMDQHDSSWSMKELKGFLKGIETEPHNITVYFDGGFDQSTSSSGLGCVVYYEQNGKSYRLRRNASVSELTTNNEAEYAALHLGLKELEELQVHHIPVKFIGDSQVVINQMSGEWPVYEKVLSDWADRVDKKIAKLGIEPNYELVERKLNSEADRLATQALNGIDITSTSERTEENN